MSSLGSETIVYPASTISEIIHAWTVASMLKGNRGVVQPVSLDIRKKLLLCLAGTNTLDKCSADITEENRIFLLRDLFAGLRAIHSRGLVHGNLLPSNIWITLDPPCLRIGGLTKCTYPDSINPDITADVCRPPDSICDMKYDIPALGLLLFSFWSSNKLPPTLEQLIVDSQEPCCARRPDLETMADRVLRLTHAQIRGSCSMLPIIPPVTPPRCLSPRVWEADMKQIEELFAKVISTQVPDEAVRRRTARSAANIFCHGGLDLSDPRRYLTLAAYLAMNLNMIDVHPVFLTPERVEDTEMLPSDLVDLMSSNIYDRIVNVIDR